MALTGWRRGAPRATGDARGQAGLARRQAGLARRQAGPARRRSHANLMLQLRAAAGAALVVAGGLALVAVTPAAAATGPDFTITESAPASVLYGTPATETLTATDTDALGSGDTPGYNLSFEDVLPAGVSYVSGSTSGAGDPTELANEPSTGETTLIWSNVADLQPASSTA
ncbi:MAG TPA: hypothetical protein VMD59_21805, partial [Acidimicrobiales bacterium]|nr:hypothetical protein [Acidimicrobiales bacterium]